MKRKITRYKSAANWWRKIACGDQQCSVHKVGKTVILATCAEDDMQIQRYSVRGFIRYTNRQRKDWTAMQEEVYGLY